MKNYQAIIEKQRELIQLLDDCNFPTMFSKEEWDKRKRLYDELAALETEEEAITDEMIERWAKAEGCLYADFRIENSLIQGRIEGAKAMRDNLITNK